MESSKKHIDEQVRQHLVDLEVKYDPSTWSGLERRMDFDAQEAVDDLFKSSIGNIEAPVVTGSWEAFEHLIEADEAISTIEKEIPVDSKAYDKLHNLRVPYKEEHWALMAKRLEEEFSIRHILYRYKIAEISLMALLLLTVFRFMPIVDGWMEDSNSAEIPASFQPSTSPNSEKQQIQVVPDGVNSIKNNEIFATPIAGAESTQSSTVPENGLPILSITNEEKIGQSVLVSELSSNTFRRVFNLKILPNIAFSAIGQEPDGNGIIDNFDSKQQKLLAIDNKRKPNPNELASLPVSKIDSEYAWEFPNVKIGESKKESDLRFSIFTTTDLNYVTTPSSKIEVFDKSYETENNETLASGYGGGVMVSWKRGRWEYQTGGIYSFKRYIPNTPIFIFETINFYIKEDFNGIQLDVFQIPLNAHYHFKNRGRWRMYATIGSSANFVTSTVYEIEHDRQALSLNSPPETVADDRKSISNELELSSGLADGGHLRDNFYMSANIGLGVERYLSPKWTVFFQPNYQHFIMSKGIGTNMDKIYTTSFHLGTKFNLK